MLRKRGNLDPITASMKYTAPSGYDFEIPDEWLDEAGVRDVRLNQRAYPVGKALELALKDVLTSLDNRPFLNCLKLKMVRTREGGPPRA